MKQGQFEQLYQPLWHVLELEIIELEKTMVDSKAVSLRVLPVAIAAFAISTPSPKIATTPAIWSISSAIW